MLQNGENHRDEGSELLSLIKTEICNYLVSFYFKFERWDYLRPAHNTDRNTMNPTQTARYAPTTITPVTSPPSYSWDIAGDSGWYITRGGT